MPKAKGRIHDDAEIVAMRDVLVAVKDLDIPTRRRVLDWAVDRTIGSDAAAALSALTVAPTPRLRLAEDVAEATG